MNLTSSFRLRNKIKERISQLQTAIIIAPFFIEEGSEEEINKTDGLKVAEACELVKNLMSVLAELNTKIEDANVINRHKLILLETTKAKIAWYEKLNNELRNVHKFVSKLNQAGGRDEIKTIPLLDQNIVLNNLKAVKKEKETIEEELAEANARINVDFDKDLVTSLL